ncbi:DNA polymerase alpha 70 kDa subunit [Tothia fuscella]|uniref:DNA polymerase alpha subunit B n=1 Tax=Tothia fuscella TaxID=1048955 RepID=A0A9P4NR42_9PEZI|nr:DNA polymerase alpha 70 kDa subunit [Tothia fuscella]
MDETTELQERFAAPNEELKPEILSELESILRLHRISPEELSYKWESYCMKMGAEETKLDLKTTRDFKKDIQEILERESRSKMQKGHEKRNIHATPRAGVGGGDVMSMLDGMIDTPARGSTIKRKSNFDTPAPKSNKKHPMSSPGGVQTPDTITTTTFADRTNSGEVVQSLNPNNIPKSISSTIPPSEPRIKLKANTDMGKFAYKTMGMKLSEASEILDDRIDEFTALVQVHHELEDSAFGNPSRESQSEIVAVGRIASDSVDGKLNVSSLVLETSRRSGAGFRVPLKVDRLQSYDFFRGKIVALRGTNASGDFFAINEVLDIPLLNYSATDPDKYDDINDRIRNGDEEDGEPRPLTIMIASGPYTTEENLDYSPLNALLTAAQEKQADTLILNGPFIDIEHPTIRDGDFELPSSFPHEPDKATLNDLFRYHISKPLIALTKALPGISIVLVPSVRDAVSKHAAYPQDRLPKKYLGLPKQVSTVTNPMTLALNEMVFGISSQDILEQMRAAQVVGGKAKQEDFYARWCKGLIEQRHFFPVFPPADRSAVALVEGEEDKVSFLPMGASLDVSYLKLGEMMTARPDVLIVPSGLNYFIKVVESVISINPGTLSKKRGPGTYARMVIQPMHPTDEQREKGEPITHRLYDRCRVDIVRI